ncbi:MAG: tetratricopeptide repeat protein [Acidobacteria bacterium]|nr:tetratricopeptide repeat protein [Acidobacteriota bacterium]MCA1642665.1 tetratricopeptide repeat protein [Acidobacteriota bacterium]
MRYRSINATLIAFALVLTVTAFWSATSTNPDGDDAANVIAADGSKVGAAEDTPTTDGAKKKGNRFARFFKAPFKAVGKLFGGGDDDKMRRLSEKDVARFESSPLQRVDDARTPAAKDIDRSGGETARDYLERGRALLAEGRLNEAITELTRAAALDRKLSQAHSLLALAYDRKGLKDRARESFERAADDSHDAQALNNVGYWLYENGNYRAAVDKLKRAARYAPSDERILNNLALAQARLGKFDDAYRSFARARGEFDGHMNAAALAERVGRDSAAIEHYEAARKIQPSSEIALRRLADLYLRNSRADDAARARQSLESAQAQLATREN